MGFFSWFFLSTYDFLTNSRLFSQADNFQVMRWMAHFGFCSSFLFTLNGRSTVYRTRVRFHSTIPIPVFSFFCFFQFLHSIRFFSNGHFGRRSEFLIIHCDHIEDRAVFIRRVFKATSGQKWLGVAASLANCRECLGRGHTSDWRGDVTRSRWAQEVAVDKACKDFYLLLFRKYQNIPARILSMIKDASRFAALRLSRCLFQPWYSRIVSVIASPSISQ